MSHPRTAGFEEIPVDAATADRLRDHPDGRAYLVGPDGRRLGLLRTVEDIERYRAFQEQNPITMVERETARTLKPGERIYTLEEVLASARASVDRAESLRRAS